MAALDGLWMSGLPASLDVELIATVIIRARVACPPLELQVLQLGDTAIGDRGARALAAALEAGAMATEGRQLWLASTPMSEASREAIMAAAARRARNLRVCW